MNDKVMGVVNEFEKKEKLKGILEILFIPCAILYMEILAKLMAFGKVFDGKFGYLFFLSTAMGFFFSFAAMLLSGGWRRIYYNIVLGVLGFWFSFHISYFCNFHTFFSWQSLEQAKDVTQFWREAIVAVENVWYAILGFFVPFVIMLAIGRLLISNESKRNFKLCGVSAAAFLILYLPVLLVINSSSNSSSEFTPYYYYTYMQNDLETGYRYYGVVNATRIDLKQLLFGAPEEDLELDDIDDDYIPVSSSDKSEEYGFNIMDIDFDSLLRSTGNNKLKKMDEYFMNVQPTQKNEYTGMFKGKNLIFITVEGFSDKIIDPEFTPLLYKMSTEGFVFRNFYNSVWGGSTATGEYANMTGNFHQNSNCLKMSGSTYQPFVLGNQFSKIGYDTFAYHNNTYTYYGRNLSHPNFGYKWKAIGNGLHLKSDCWPRSDREMAEATIGDYISLDVPFHAYYMTVSGHANYTYAGNMMSMWHRSDLTARIKKYPSNVRAYFACQYELELMLRVLVDELEKAGKLDDTVFAMSADHYPYALSDEELSVLYGLPKSGIRNNFDLYRNGFILWSSSMDNPVTVDVPCSTIDILPTLSNLFGLEYDSRLLMGRDIMAPGEHFALLKVSGWSWISEQGSYKASSQKFTPGSECTLSDDEKDDYISRMNKLVKAKTTYSKKIIDNDYYAHVFGK